MKLFNITMTLFPGEENEKRREVNYYIQIMTEPTEEVKVERNHQASVW